MLIINDIFLGFIRALMLILNGNSEVIHITLLSLRVSGTATLIGACISIPLGTMLAMYNFPGKSFVTHVMNTMISLPPVVVGLLVFLLLSTQGPLGFLELLYTPTAMIFAQLILVIPICMAVTFSSITSVDRRIQDTISSLNFSSIWKIKIMINETKIGILTSIIAGFGAAISEVGAIMIVGGNLNGFTRVLTSAIVLKTNQGMFDEAIALGLILLFLAFIINGVMTFLQFKIKKGIK